MTARCLTLCWGCSRRGQCTHLSLTSHSTHLGNGKEAVSMVLIREGQTSPWEGKSREHLRVQGWVRGPYPERLQVQSFPASHRGVSVSEPHQGDPTPAGTSTRPHLQRSQCSVTMVTDETTNTSPVHIYSKPTLLPSLQFREQTRPWDSLCCWLL